MRKLLATMIAAIFLTGFLITFSAFAETGGAATSSLGGSGNIFTALGTMISSFEAAFAAIADAVVQLLYEIWLSGGETTRCCLGIFIFLIMILSMVGVVTLNSTVSAYRRYIG